MRRVHRHPRLLSALAFGLLALVAELVGRSLTHRVDLGRHVASPSYSGAEYYPILLGVVKGAIALLLARLLWRLLKAHAAERAARRLLGSRARRPRLRVTLSPRLTLTFFAVTAVIYLVQADAEGVAAGRWPLVLALAALVGPARVRRPLRSLRARLGRGAGVARRVRGVCAGLGRARAPARRPRRAACLPAADRAHRSSSPHLRTGLREPSASARCLTPRSRPDPAHRFRFDPSGRQL